MLNSCILTGNLGANPEVFYGSEGDPVATFNLAFRSSKETFAQQPSPAVRATWGGRIFYFYLA
jgi:single-stranded DNA-binding protein